MSYSVRLWNVIAERYARKPVADEQTYQRKLAKTQEYFRPDMAVLEFGCGTGSTALVHAAHVRSYRAVDVSPKMVEIARRKLAAEPHANLNFEVSAVEDLNVQNDSLDAVLGLSILHLLKDPEAIIQRVFHMLKPGGFFASSTVCTGHMGTLPRLLLRVARATHLVPLVQPFRRSELKELMRCAGFRIECELDPGDFAKACFLIVSKPTNNPVRQQKR